MIWLALTILLCAVILRDLGKAWIKRMDISTYQGKQLEILRSRQATAERAITQLQDELDKLRKSTR